MQTRTISPSGYKALFDSLSRIYSGSSATLELLDKDFGAQHEVDEQPLRGISYDKDGLELHLTTRDGTHLVHRIPQPKRVQLEERDDGLVEAIAIESEGDPRAILHFHPAVASRLLGAATQ
ncbi:MAG TPA: DUF5335 family protein [Thermoanaerobaculia bacterium]|nr:DUF5335 family protein [Thermoanaerobaculia bacterium]